MRVSQVIAFFFSISTPFYPQVVFGYGKERILNDVDHSEHSRNVFVIQFEVLILNVHCVVLQKMF